MRAPRWWTRWVERERARPRSPIDHWLAKQREYVLRLPRWLVGSTLCGSVALGVYWAATGTGLMRLLRHVYRVDLAAMATIAFTMLPVMAALYGVARWLRPHPPSNLPPAHLRE